MKKVYKFCVFSILSLVAYNLFLSSSFANQIVYLEEKKFLDITLVKNDEDYILYLKKCNIVEKNLENLNKNMILSTKDCTPLGDGSGYVLNDGVRDEVLRLLGLLGIQDWIVRTSVYSASLIVGGGLGAFSGWVGYLSAPLLMDKEYVPYGKWISAAIFGLGIGKISSIVTRFMLNIGATSEEIDFALVTAIHVANHVPFYENYTMNTTRELIFGKSTFDSNFESLIQLIKDTLY